MILAYPEKILSGPDDRRLLLGPTRRCREDQLIAFEPVWHVDNRAWAEANRSVGAELVHRSDAALGRFNGAPSARQRRPILRNDRGRQCDADNRQPDR
jgi:hypothetical protein